MRHGDRGTFNNVARLWPVVLLANLVGAFAFAPGCRICPRRVRGVRRGVVRGILIEWHSILATLRRQPWRTRGGIRATFSLSH